MRGKTKLGLVSLLEISLGAALMAVSSMLSISFAVPITLQTLALYIILFTLGGRKGCLATLVYISLGAFGLPVFSGFSGGVSRIFDYGGGFIVGFLIASLVFWLFDSLFLSGGLKPLSAAISLLALYTSGAVWYFVFYTGDISFFAVLSACVFPFVIPDAIKIFVAYLISKRLSLAVANSKN